MKNWLTCNELLSAVGHNWRGFCRDAQLVVFSLIGKKNYFFSRMKKTDLLLLVLLAPLPTCGIPIRGINVFRHFSEVLDIANNDTLLQFVYNKNRG
jgi:hypothetical protein